MQFFDTTVDSSAVCGTTVDSSAVFDTTVDFSAVFDTTVDSSAVFDTTVDSSAVLTRRSILVRFLKRPLNNLSSGHYVEQHFPFE